MNAQEKPRYLTKSRFKLALECPTKLYYSKPSNGYFDKNQNNDFLQALADGGNQVGEIAKFKYHPNLLGMRSQWRPWITRNPSTKQIRCLQ